MLGQRRRIGRIRSKSVIHRLRPEAGHLLPGSSRHGADQGDRDHLRMRPPGRGDRIGAAAEVAIATQEPLILALDAALGERVILFVVGPGHAHARGSTAHLRSHRALARRRIRAPRRRLAMVVSIRPFDAITFSLGDSGPERRAYSGLLERSPARIAKQGTVEHRSSPPSGENRVDRPDFRTRRPVRHSSRTDSALVYPRLWVRAASIATSVTLPRFCPTGYVDDCGRTCGASGTTAPSASGNSAATDSQRSRRPSPPVRRRRAGAWPDMWRSSRPFATAISTRSASPPTLHPC